MKHIDASLLPETDSLQNDKHFDIKKFLNFNVYHSPSKKAPCGVLIF
jgi:hypothetical protein